METLSAIPAPALSTLTPASTSALVGRYLGDAGELLRELEVCAGPRRFSRDYVLPIFREAMRSPLPRSIVLSRQVPPARSIRLDEALALCHLAAAAARIEITPVTLRHVGALGIAELSVEVVRGAPPRVPRMGWLTIGRQMEGQPQVSGSDLRKLFRLAAVASEVRLEGVCWRVVRADRAYVELLAQLGGGSGRSIGRGTLSLGVRLSGRSTAPDHDALATARTPRRQP